MNVQPETFEPQTHQLVDDDGVTVFVYEWRPQGSEKGVVQLLHGMGEHARRYDHVAAALNDAGYVVYADDHRASGRTGAQGSGLGDLGPRAMEGALDSVHAVTRFVRAREHALPLFLLGHSWGSFLAQQYAARWGDELVGLILSGSTLLVAEYTNLGDFNEPFAPTRTPYDWLSRDEHQVDLYVDDPWCGFEVAFPLEELLFLFAPPRDTIPASLPVFVFNGTHDAVGGWNGGGRALATALLDLGLADVTFKDYAEGRHEMFNETNRDEVLADVVAWLDAHCPVPG